MDLGGLKPRLLAAWEWVGDNAPWLPAGLLALGAAFVALFGTFTVIAAVSALPFGWVTAMTLVTLAGASPVVLLGAALAHSITAEKLARPGPGPDRNRAQMAAHRSRWDEAVEEYERVLAEHPSDLESLWALVEIYRERAPDPELHEITLRRICVQHDLTGAGPAWIAEEARMRLDHIEAPEAPVRPTEIELPE